MKSNYDSFGPYVAMTNEVHRFEKELIGIEGRIPSKMLENLPGAKLESYYDNYCHDLVIRLTHKVAFGDKVLKEEIDVPLTWWDHFKFDLNSWAWGWLVNKDHFFFTNIAKAITALKITPRFRAIPVMTQTSRNYCPHVSNGDNRPHVEFMLQRSLRENYHG